MSKLAVANIIFETTEANRIEYTGNNVVRVRANGGLQIPFGTTDQRVSPEYGIIRYNTDLQTVEMYDAGGWYNMPTGGYVNSIYTVANSAYAAANNVGPQIAPTFNTANAAFDSVNAFATYANNEFLNLNWGGELASDLFIKGYTLGGAYVTFKDCNNGYSLATQMFMDTGSNFTINYAGQNYVYFKNTGSFGVGSVYGAERLYVGSSASGGNVGIGTTSPAYKLDVTGTINAANILINGAAIVANLAPAFNQANAAYAAANTKFSSSGGTISGAVEITADLTVHGNTRFIDQQTLSVGDPLIYLAANNYSSDVVDIGFVANYVNATSSNVHTGLFRSSGTKEYYLFQGYDKEPYNNYIDPTGNNITMAVLNSTVRTSNLILGGANTINWIGAAYASINSNWTVTNTVYGVANAAYGAANSKVATVSGTSGRITSSGTTGITLDLATAGAGAGSYSSGISALTVDAYGRVTSVTGSANYALLSGATFTGGVSSTTLSTNGTFSQSGGFGYIGSFNTQGYPTFGSAATTFSWNFSGGSAENNIWNPINPSIYPNSGFRFMQLLSASTYRDVMFIRQDGNVGIGTISPSVSLDVGSRTDAIKLPVGTTAQRPTGANGLLRYNSSISSTEIYQYGTWSTISTIYSIEYLVVAGGGAGGGEYVGGGGGAGGYLSGSTSITSGTQNSIVIGAGATGVAAVQVAASGSNSTALGLIAYGGGGGGVGNRGASVAQATSGGSGGGSGAYGSPTNSYGSGTAGQGNRGGSGWDGINQFTAAGGGGGAGGVGGNAGTSAPSNTQGGAGGVGLQWSNGTYYAGGGGGGTDNGAAGWSGLGGTGGTGGGGNGGSYTVYTAATNGSTNTGGGGGGSTRTATTGGNGGSGIVIIRYAGSQRGSGGTVTSAGGYTYHTFTTSGTFIA